VAAKPRIEIRCPHCDNVQWEPETVQSTNCRKCGSYIHLEKGHIASPGHELALHRHEESKGRVDVTCPSCANHQQESVSAKSTYCRKCGGYIQLDKSAKSSISHEPREHALSSLQKLQDLLGVQRTIVARCFECPGIREVPKTATSTLCPKCGAYIDLQDYKIAGAYTRSVRTGGRLIITVKGDLISRRAYCGSAEIEGSLRAKLICSGDVTIKRKGKVGGEIEARNIHIDKRCDAELAFPIRADVVEIDGAITVPKVSARKVVINKTGRLTGAVSANGFVVEKGGYFAGDLAIGEYDKSLDARSLTNLTGAASPEAEGSHATGATESRADM
jgi:cytoskeletal protein CcmA (bactofilin family)/ribosomal protein L40E